MNAIINKLEQTLESRTQAALAGLDSLERQVAHAIEQAEAAARERIDARLEGILKTVESSLSGFTARVTEMAAHALETALHGIGSRLDTLSPATTPEPVSEPASPAPEAVEQGGEQTTGQPTEGTPEWFATVNAQLDQQAARDREQGAQTVAACALPDDGVAVLEAEHPGTIPTTTNPSGLHEREPGTSGRARYTPVENPEPGAVYWVRDHRRHWSQVRYAR